MVNFTRTTASAESVDAQRESRSLYRSFLATVSSAELPAPTVNTNPVSAADIADLPQPVQRYLRFMGVIGRPRDHSFRANFIGRFRRAPGQNWMACDAWQYNTALPIARVFHMRARLMHVVPMVARDTYIEGHGRMLVKLLDRFTVADGIGDEFDIGELSTFLNDAVLLAPSMLLNAGTTWRAVDHFNFNVTLTDGPRTVTALVTVDDLGAPRNFTTTDRFAALATGTVQAEWSTPVEAWTISRGRPVPTGASAVWMLPEGPFTYIEGHYRAESIRYNAGPDRAGGGDETSDSRRLDGLSR